MSELRSVVESLRAESLADASDELIEERFEEIHRGCEQLEMERLRTLCEIDRRRVFERDGHLSCAAWIVSRFRVAWGEARTKVRMARALSQMSETRRAVEEGEISIAAARVLTEAQQAQPETFAGSEAALVEAARLHTVGDLQRVVSVWREHVEAEGSSAGPDRLRARRRLHASTTFGGMVRVDGDLDPETGETLLTALGAVLDAEAHSRTEEDSRSPAQRRADALGEICRQWLDRSDRPQVEASAPTSP